MDATYTLAAVSAVLVDAGIACREWSGDTVCDRAYITDAGLEALGLRVANQRRKASGAYVEIAEDGELTVSGLGYTRGAESALITILRAAGYVVR
jgi:hypothetical protein